MSPDKPDTREADDAIAPVVFLYTGLVAAWLAVVLVWVFWCRGYA